MPKRAVGKADGLRGGRGGERGGGLPDGCALEAAKETANIREAWHHRLENALLLQVAWVRCARHEEKRFDLVCEAVKDRRAR